MFGTGDVDGAVRDEEGDEFGDLLGTTGATERIPPRESISARRAASRSPSAALAMRSIRRSAAVVSMKPGATELTRTPRGPT